MSVATPANTHRRIRRRIDIVDIERLLAGDWATSPESDAEASFLLLYAARGTVRLGGRAARRLSEGTLLILRDEPLTLRVEPESSALVVRVPAEALVPYRATVASMVGTTWPSAEGTANLVGHLLNGLANQIQGFDPRSPGRFAQHLIGFIALLCADEATEGVEGTGGYLGRAQHYVEDHLDDVGLGPESIARAQSISVRSLNRAFEQNQLTVRGWIRERRLERCRIDLLDADLDGLAVSAIGARWGLWDAAHFSRIFKANYGASPLVYRKTRGEAPAA